MADLTQRHLEEVQASPSPLSSPVVPPSSPTSSSDHIPLPGK